MKNNSFAIDGNVFFLVRYGNGSKQDRNVAEKGFRMSNLGNPELMIEQSELKARLDQAIRLMGKYGREYAENERAYKVALAQETLRLRDSGMAVGIIDKVVLGNVSDSRFKRDESEILYKTAQENINAIKLQLRLLESQIEREWHNVG